MKIVHVMPSIAKEASGPSYSVSRLVMAMINDGASVTLTALDWDPLSSGPDYLRTFSIGCGPRRLGRSPAMRRWLMDEARSGRIQIIHNHGMWQFNSIYPSQVASSQHIPFVSSPRGALSTWAMKHGSTWKRLFWPLLQRPALMKTTCFHATADTELADIRRLGFRQPVAVIPNGIDVLPQQQVPKAHKRTILFLGRIHPVKGLDMLLPAWKRIEEQFPNWRLAIAGSDVGYGGGVGYLEKIVGLADQLQLKHVDFLGELRGQDKFNLMQQAELFVLPSYSENFGIAVAEALAAGTPAIVTQGAPWHELARFDAGWHIETSEQALVSALQHALSLPSEQLQQMGQNGRKWMLDHYSWEKIGAMMLATYEWLLNPESSRPSWIYIS